MHGIGPAKRDECRCSQCRHLLLRARDMANEYRRGKSLAAIGRYEGLSHERVRQILMELEPGIIDEVRQTKERRRKHAAEILARIAMQDRILAERPCEVCGSATAPYRRTCSTECSALWQQLRRLVDKEQFDRWIKTALDGHNRREGTDYQPREAPRRWLIPGSANEAAVRTVIERGYPIAARLPVQVRKQVEDSAKG